MTGTIRNRTAVIEEAEPGIQVERYGSRFDSEGAPDVERWFENLRREAETLEYRPMGKVIQVFLGRPPAAVRDVDFQKTGPMLALSKQYGLVIPTPVNALPPRIEMKKGRPRLECPKIEQYASGLHAGCYVLQPLVEILFCTLIEEGSHLHFVHFHPDAHGREPVLLFDPQRNCLGVWGGGGYHID